MAKLGRTISLSIILYILTLSIRVPSSYAVTIPSFPSCVNPQGALIASYDSGTHGVVGNPSTFTGRDSVYTISGDTNMQCLCSDSGQGIQTNWWKVASLGQNEINILVSQGWILISDGSAWGLDPVAYLAQNLQYTCGGALLGGGTGGGDGLSDGRSSSVQNTTGGAVLGISTNVLGLANTGNSLFILGMFVAGLAAISTGFILNLKKK